MERHIECLGNVCRVCGEPHITCATSKGHKTANQIACPTTKYQDQIKDTFSIDTTNDEHDVHPPKICRRCIRKTSCAKTNEGLRMKYRNKPKITWKSHPRTNKDNCFTCSKLQLCKAGTRKRTYPHLVKPLPFRLNVDNIFDKIAEPMGSITTRQPQDLAAEDELRPLYTCHMCSLILANPVQTPCEHFFCSACLSKKFQMSRSVGIPCPQPQCSVTLKYSDVASVSKTFRLNFKRQKLKCSSCPQQHLLGSTHTCPGPTPTQHLPAAAELTQLALSHPMDQPVPESVAETVGVWLNVMFTGDRQTLQLKSKPTAKKVSIHLQCREKKIACL